MMLEKNPRPLPAARLLTIREVADRLGVSIRKVYRMVAAEPGFPKPVRVGTRSTRFLEGAIGGYIASLESA